MESLLKNCEIIANTANVTTDSSRQTPLVDMSDALGCAFFLIGTSVGGSSKLTAHVQMTSSTSVTPSTCTYPVTAAISSSLSFGGAAAYNAKVAIVDVIRPTKRYVRVSWINSTGTIDRFLMIKHHLRRAGSTTLWDSTSLGPTTCVIGCSTA